MGFIYLVQPCELLGTNRFKIGCSDKVGLDRLFSYKIGTRYICFFEVDHPFDAESELKLKYSAFNNIAGREYFEGDEYAIKNCFIEFILDYHQSNKKPVEGQNDNRIYHEVQCDFKNYCEQCRRGTLSNNQSIIDHYCMERCGTCDSLRKTQSKFYNKELCKQLLSNLSINDRNSKSVVGNDNSLVVDANTEKNTIIVNNNLNINIKTVKIIINDNYIYTKDRYYYVQIVTLEKDIQEQINRLKYIFTNKMTGSNGRSIYPNEKKHSEITSFAVKAAMYTIKTDNVEKPTLYGLLSYEYSPD